MASNSGTLLDTDGDSSDWIEIQNRSDNPVQLLGWSLTDNPTRPNKWRFPYAVLDPHAYTVIFASGKDRATDSAPLISDFHATPDATFVVDLPLGSYNVRLTIGDVDVWTIAGGVGDVDERHIVDIGAAG